MTNADSNPTLLAATAQAHDSTTDFHAFVYFAREAAAEYKALGASGFTRYFAPRTAAMGALSAEMVTATFYNFSPDAVNAGMDGVWDLASPEQFQAARWRGVRQVLDQHVRPILSDQAIGEAIAICERSIASLSWAGRPMAAGNNAVLDQLETDEFAGDDLLKLWQQVTVLREWRGDAHIALLVAEPLDGAECTVVSGALADRAAAMQSSRGWSDPDWTDASERLRARGWLNDDARLTEMGRDARSTIEHRTNELASAMWMAGGEADALRLDALLAPASQALVDANYFAAVGRPGSKTDS